MYCFYRLKKWLRYKWKWPGNNGFLNTNDEIERLNESDDAMEKIVNSQNGKWEQCSKKIIRFENYRSMKDEF